MRDAEQAQQPERDREGDATTPRVVLRSAIVVTASVTPVKSCRPAPAAGAARGSSDGVVDVAVADRAVMSQRHG